MKQRVLRVGFTALLAVGALGCSQEGLNDGPKHQLTASAVASDARLIDAPSEPPVVLRFSSALDGKAARGQLEIEIENTTGQRLDVDLRATSSAGSRTAAAPPRRIRLNPSSSVAEAIAIDGLPIQVTGSAATTLITATYTLADGVARAAALPAVWIEHEAGFRTARVRDALNEASSNAARSFAELRDRRPTSARVRDAASGRISSLAVASDDSLNGGVLTLQRADLPTPAQIIAMIPPAPADTASGASDAVLAASAPSTDGAFDKGGNYRVCFRLPYWYTDSLFGEDYLIGQTATAEGYEPARYMLAVLQNSVSQIIWSGNLDSGGCTPLVNHPNGFYSGSVTTSIYRPASDVLIDVTPDDTKQFVWGSQTYNIFGSGGTQQLVFGGAWSLTDAAVAAANSLYRSTTAYPNGTRTDIYADQNCPDPEMMNPNSGCASGSQIWLGPNRNGFPYAGFKVVVHHELGHRVQDALLGLPAHPYAIDAPQASCRCDHVTSSNNLHCLQSRHKATAAQVEGWGQFFAATNLNLGTQSNCTFVYYKEFRNDTGTVTLPPLSKSCFNNVLWMANHCPSSDRGTEYDWMNFYWRVDNKDNYSYTDFKSVYQSACSGSCAGDDVTWSMTVNAAAAVFGAGSTKHNAWNVQGSAFGVAY